MVIELLAQGPRPLYGIFTDVWARNKPAFLVCMKMLAPDRPRKCSRLPEATLFN